MFNAESATLILRSNDLTLGATNAVGTADTFLLNMTWNNINLRTLLGSMYEKYDRFVLVPYTNSKRKRSWCFWRNC